MGSLSVTPSEEARWAGVVTPTVRASHWALVTASGRVLAPQPIAAAAPAAVTRSGSARVARPSSEGGVAAGTCAGTTYAVRSGDTLWAIAARSVGSSSGKQVEVRWHRVYAENSGVIGADPSMLPVGVKLCLPAM